MSLNVSGLSAWTDENKLDLIKSAILKGRTVDLVNVQPGIKNSAAINILTSPLTAAAGACGWSATGSTTLTQRDITVCNIKVNEAICLNTLEDYYTSAMMKPGSYNESIPFEGIYAEEKRDQVQALVEDLFWKGNTVTGSGNLALCDGMISLLLTASASTISPTASAGEISASNAIAVVDAMVAAVPADIIDQPDLYLFMSYANYRTWATALRNANLFAYSGAENQGQEFSQMVPGTNVKAIAVRGLNGAGGDMVLTTASNLYLGTDLLSDGEDFAIWYSKDNDEVRFLSKFKFGVQVAFPTLIVHYDAVS